MSFFSSIGRVAGGFITGGPVGAVTAGIGLLSGGGGSSGNKKVGAIPNSIVPGGQSPLSFGNFGPSSPCPGMQVRGPLGTCINLMALPPGGAPAISPRPTDAYGNAVAGWYGTALEPATSSTLVRHCPPGAVLGKDNLCYNRKALRRDERKWNPGRPPLLTGGERNAITTAARAAGKVQRTEKQLRKLGMLAAPCGPRKRRKA